MKTLQLSPEDRERIELKFECMRRSDAYKRDYDMQEMKIKKFKDEKNYFKLETHLYSKWFHFPLLPPNISIGKHKKVKGQKYFSWLGNTLAGLVTSDSLCPQFVTVDAPELRKYLAWKKRGYKNILEIKRGRIKRVPFPSKNMAIRKLDARMVEQELRNLRISVDMYDFDLTRFRKGMDALFEELKPLVKWFLYKGSNKKSKLRMIRNKAAHDYLKTHDKKQTMSYRNMSNHENQQRKYKKHVRDAKALINGQWHYI